MEEKKGLLSALAETLKQYEQNQADNKDSLAIALEEKLEEIAKMISSLSDRVDHLSARLNSIDNKVDAISQTQTEEPILSADETSPIPEPVFDAIVNNSFEEDEEEFSYETTEPEDEKEPAEAVEETEPEDSAEEVVEAAETADETSEEAEPADDETEAEEEAAAGEETEPEDASEEEPEEQTEKEEAEDSETEGDAEVAVAEKDAENEAPVAEKKGKDWYDWEYDYPAEYVDDILGSMGINDKLEFVRELFHSDPALFNSQMTEIDTMPNFKAIVQFFRQAHPEWKEDSDTVYRLYMHIRRKFRN